MLTAIVPISKCHLNVLKLKQRRHKNSDLETFGAETMTSASTTAESRAVATPETRWTQLIICIICMVLIANLQYGWTLFVNPINKAHGWSLASIQFAFSIFIALE